ncbi:MAG: FMN-binding protein [Elusimicrobiota bacterium]
MRKIIVIILSLAVAFIISSQKNTAVKKSPGHEKAQEKQQKKGGVSKGTVEKEDPSPGLKKDVVKKGTGQGFAGKIIVEVTFENRGPGSSPVITDIEVIESREISKYWNKVRGEIIPRIIDNQTTDIDAVSGATQSSEGLLEAIQDAKNKLH